MTFSDKLKQKIWHVIYKFFPTLQKALLRMGIIHHEKGRQRYHIGWVAPGRTLAEIKVHLHTKWGFGNHFVAWKDEGQVLSWRKLQDFNDQYHLRVFEDREIRGHFEFTPEAHPLAHFEETGEKDATADFLKFLGEFVTIERTFVLMEIDPEAYNPDSEVTIEQKM